MKILTIIALIGNILSPIKSDRYKNSYNDTGSSSFNNFVQVTYEYYCEEPSYTVGLSAGVISGETQIPLIYSIKLNIKLRDPVESAYIKLNFTSPLGSSPYWDIPALCENATIGYVDADDLYVYLYNTDYASIYIVYTYEQVMKRYGYQYIGQINALDPMSPEWIENGYTYCDLLSVTLDSATLSTSSDYSSQLNSIMTYTDGIENYLSQILTNTSTIITNTSYLSTISTNINTAKTTLSNLYTIAQRDNYLNQLLGGLIQSQNHSVDTIYNVLNNYHDTVLPTQFTGGTGPQDPAQYVYIYDLNNDINTQLNRDKLKIVIQFKSYGFENDYYYVNVPIYESNTVQTFNEHLILYSKYSNIIANVGCSFKITNNYVSLWISLSNTSISTGSTTSVPLSNLSTYILNIFVTDQSITSNQKLDDIISLIDSLAVNVDVDMTNKNTVDSFFEELRQSLTLPSIPQSFNDTIFEKMGILLKPYVSMVINFSRYRNVLMIASLFTIIGVILL